ncbi:catabolite control protein A [Periweissella fabaria]|uniref:Catabolite control protein A n=1 Tax=Periweissella fabaria TaxID=546157 RepID=A0ABN8BGM9_9LACO|nr:catabolite control protein A [Periweissella fabaria]MCM0596517.1 catabolite control protein A [Periweissella fabaria]CAH0415754.1 Catabolite control protein A [Periweissella fabaria]
MEKENVTIYDVAREAGVSMATVSRVVNGNSNVKQATKDKVLAVIDRLDYRPNAVARGLASKKTTTVGVIIPDVTDMFFSELARGVDDVASMYHYNIILANSDDSGTKELQVLENLLAKQVDGIVYMGNGLREQLRNQFSHSNVPIVLAGGVDEVNQIPTVNIDYTAATKDAVTKLIKNGHTQIAFIPGNMQQAINQKYRLRGYQEALEEAGIAFDETMVFDAQYTYNAGFELANELYATTATAAFVGADELAAGILNGLTDRGVNVPEDFEIITAINTKLTQITRPQLSSISIPMYDMGAVAMRMLTKLMDKENIENGHLSLPYGIISRQTTR